MALSSDKHNHSNLIRKPSYLYEGRLICGNFKTANILRMTQLQTWSRSYERAITHLRPHPPPSSSSSAKCISRLLKGEEMWHVLNLLQSMHYTTLEELYASGGFSSSVSVNLNGITKISGDRE